MPATVTGCSTLRAAALVLVLLCGGGTARAQHEEQVAPLVDAHWVRGISAVQSRAHPLDRRFELGLVAAVIPNDPFLFYVPLGGWVAFNLRQGWALQATVTYQLQADTGLRDYLQQHDAQLRATLRDRQQLRANVGLAWAPVYGKFALGQAVQHFDLQLSLGGGIVRTAEESALGLSAATRPDFHLGLGLRLFFGQRWLLRLYYRQYLFLRPQAEGEELDLGFPAELGLGVGILLGGTR